MKSQTKRFLIASVILTVTAAFFAPGRERNILERNFHTHCQPATERVGNNLNFIPHAAVVLAVFIVLVARRLWCLLFALSTPSLVGTRDPLKSVWFE